MKGLGAAVVVAIIAVMVLPIGVVMIGTVAVAPAIAEQIRIDPCSAYDTTTADSAHLSHSSSSFGLPTWGTPRHQSLSSPVWFPRNRGGFVMPRLG